MKLSKELLYEFFINNPFIITFNFSLSLFSYYLHDLLIPKYTSKLATDAKLEETVIPVLIVWLMSQALMTVSSTIYAYLQPKFNSFIRDKLIERVYNKFQYEYNDVDLSTFINRFISTPGNLKDITSEFIQAVLPKVFVILITLYYYYTVDKNMTYVIIVILAIGIYIVTNQIGKCYLHAIDRHQTFTNLSKRFHDKLSNLFSVYISGLKDYEINDGKKINNVSLKKHRRTLYCINRVRSYSTGVSVVIFVFILITALRLHKQNVLSKEASAQLILTTITFIGNFYWMMLNFSNIIEDLGLLNETEKFLESIESKVKPRSTLFESKNGDIKINNVTFGYPKRKSIFTNFNLFIPAGTKIAFTGPSGSGKSTLIKLLLGFYPLQNGNIEIDNQDINDVSLDSLRKNVTYISQNTKLFDKSIYYNINYGNNKTKQEIDTFIENIGIQDIFNNLTNGFNTRAGINGDQLSGGQKQLVHILRGFIGDNNIIILDEPTSAIDIYHKQIIKNLIRKLSENKTLILITHEKDMLDLVDVQIDISSITQK